MGCDLAAPDAGNSDVAVAPQLTAAVAREAVLDLIRAHPNAFIGKPDPDRLAQLPLQDLGKGQYSFGAFILDLPGRSYQASVGHGAPVVHLYSGTFKEKDGKWVASYPQSMRAHQR
jgi:hypothetical protein